MISENIQQYKGKTVVIKYGGNAMINEELKHQVTSDIAKLHKEGVKVVLVHGGGPEINDLMARLGKKPEFVDGLRVTDKETVDIVLMVLAGKVNKNLVSLLSLSGAEAIGISGIDGSLIEAEIKEERLGFVGKITASNPKIVNDILSLGYIPVISTVGCDKSGNFYNINGDTAAAFIAGALSADRLIMMTDIDGVLKDRNDPSTLIRTLSLDESEKLKDDGIIAGGMIPKVDCCTNAVRKGVKSVSIINGTVPHSLILELSSGCGIGTVFTE